jgi:hypothetical protein
MTAPCARLSLFKIGHVRAVQIVHHLIKAAMKMRGADRLSDYSQLFHAVCCS